MTADDAKKFGEQVETIERDFKARMRQRFVAIWMTGALAFVTAVLVANREVLTSAAEGPSSAGGTVEQWSFGWRVELATAGAAVIGLLAVIATISVAVMAAAWRPRGLPIEHDLPIMLANRILARASIAAASATVTFALLSLGAGPGPLVLLAMAVIASLISVATWERSDTNELRVQWHYAKREEQQSRRALELFDRRHPWAVRITERGQARDRVLLYAVPASTVFLALILTLLANAFARGLSVGALTAQEWVLLVEALAGAMGNWMLLALLSLIPVVGSTYFAGMAVEARYQPGSAALTWFAGASATFMGLVPLVWLYGMPGQDGTVAEILYVESVLLPPLSAVLMLLLGRSGRGPGRHPWRHARRSAVRALEASKRRVQEVQATWSAEPNVAPRRRRLWTSPRRLAGRGRS